MNYQTGWTVEALKAGMVIYNPPLMEVDPLTRASTGRLQKFEVGA